MSSGGGSVSGSGYPNPIVFQQPIQQHQPPNHYPTALPQQQWSMPPQSDDPTLMAQQQLYMAAASGFSHENGVFQPLAPLGPNAMYPTVNNVPLHYYGVNFVAPYPLLPFPPAYQQYQTLQQQQQQQQEQQETYQEESATQLRPVKYEQVTVGGCVFFNPVYESSSNIEQGKSKEECPTDDTLVANDQAQDAAQDKQNEGDAVVDGVASNTKAGDEKTKNRKDGRKQKRKGKKGTFKKGYSQKKKSVNKEN